MNHSSALVSGIYDIGFPTSYPKIVHNSCNVNAASNGDENIVRTIGIVVGIIDICLGTSGNLLTIIAILENKKLQNTFHTFIVSLCFVDLLTAAVMMPFNVASYILQTWPFGKHSITCSIQAYSYYCCGYSSIVCLLVITANRFVGVLHPERYRRVFSRRRVWITVFISWIFAPAVMAPFFFLKDMNGRPGYGWMDEYSLCVFQTGGDGNAYLKPYMNFTRILFQAVPLIVMIILYGIIFNTVRKCGRDVMRMSIRSARSVEANHSQTSASIVKCPKIPEVRSNEIDYKRDHPELQQMLKKDVVAKQGDKGFVGRFHRPSLKSSSSTKSEGMAAIARRRRVMDRRLLSISVTICGVFMILFLPSVIVNLLPCAAYLNPRIHKCASIITWLNSCVNPIIYCFMDQKLRLQYRHILGQLGCLFCRCFGKRGGAQFNISQERSSLRISKKP